VPDVAGNAGLSTGYLITNPQSPQHQSATGGTSAAAPMWAALMACVREALADDFPGSPPTHHFNDFIYQSGASAAFRDVSGGRACGYDANGPVFGDFTLIGNNRSTVANGYYGAKGYNLCTGWGAPDGVEILRLLRTWLLSPAASASASSSVRPT
jgi:subtilase family serine protease